MGLIFLSPNIGKELPLYVVWHARRAQISSTLRRKPEILLSISLPSMLRFSKWSP